MARPRQSRTERGARRAARREAQAEEHARAAVVSRRTARYARLAVWAAATAVLLVLGASAIRNKVSWYLAVDQLGYLLFARDLLDARLFHEWPPAAALATVLPSPTDVLAQSYLWDDGRLYSRYAPGFPMLLAVWTGLFGGFAAHALNPTLFVSLLGVLVALVWRVHGSPWRGTAAAALVFVCPTGASLWALTVTRDVSAHLFGFAGLALLAGAGPLTVGRTVAAGLALGFAGSIRPDAVLYLVPATILAWGRWRPHRARTALARLTAAGSLGVLLGLAPSLSFYWATTGSPFTPPQAVEVEDFFGPPRLELPPGGTAAEAAGDRAGYPPRAWRGGSAEPVSGEGMKLTYLLSTLPGNLQKIRAGYGDVLLALAAAGFVATAIVRPVFACAIGAYMVVALLFYSCWGRPYGRYLVSIWLFMPILIVNGAVGTADVVRLLRRRGARDLALWAAAGLAVLLVAVHLAAGPKGGDGTSLLAVTRVLVLATGMSLAAAIVWPARRIARVAAPVVGLALVFLAAARLTAPSPRATFQRGEVQRATATVRQRLAPRAVVVTSEDVGRPAENLEYYAGVPSLYLTDLERWRVPIERAAFFFLVAELEPYLLIPRALPARDRILETLRSQFLVELVADVPPARNYDYFVASSYHAGVPLELWHIR